MILFFVLAILEAAVVYSETKSVVDLRLLLSLGWPGGIGLSVLKLTEWGQPFSIASWISFGAFYFGFLLAYDLVAFLMKRRKSEVSSKSVSESRTRTFLSIFIVAGLSLVGLLLEAIRFDFVFPIFAVDTPHAYTEFHLSGVHYFVVSAATVSGMSVYFCLKHGPTKKEIAILSAVNALSVLVPVLLLSKLHLAMFFVFPVIVFLLLQRRWKPGRVLAVLIGIVVGVAALFVVMVFLRQYPEGYLQEIFRFKDQRVPVGLQYPYVYVTNNFENFNLLTLSGDPLALGRRQFYFVICLTGLKFYPPVNMEFAIPSHVTVTELNTLTILYDAYADFGITGTAVFGILSGAFGAFLTDRVRRAPRISGVMIYMELAVYFALSFFTTWLSHPTTWFWFAAAFAVGLFTKKKGEPLW